MEPLIALEKSTLSEATEPSALELRRLRSEQLVYHRDCSVPKLPFYQYRRFQNGEDIRLLKVSFTGTTREVSYELVHRCLFEISGQFVAISYRWGILRPDRFIPVTNPDVNMPVTRVVKTLLEHIIGDLDIPYIWIDAICINQIDAQEKNDQVSIMSRIFGSAKSVRVWLGRLNEEEEESFVWFWLKLMFRRDFHKSVFGFKSFGVSDKYFRLLLGSEWFERVWVIQEVCLAREVFFHFGKIIISIDRLHEFVQLRLKYPHTNALVDTRQRFDLPHDFLLTAFRVLQEFSTIRAFIKERQEGLRNLSDVYASFADQKATDPRDNIYALLGLMHPQSLGGIQPDYLSDTASTYIDATVRMIDAQGQLSVLGFAGLTRGTSSFRSTRRLPTWVPDFSTAPTADVWSRCKAFKASSVAMLKPIRFFLMPKFHQYFTWNSGSLISGASISDPFGRDSEMFGCISLSAVIIDRVDGVGSWPRMFDDSGARVNAKRNMYETLLEAYRHCEGTGARSNQTKEKEEMLCWKLLIANLDGEDMADDMLEDVRAFIASLMVLQGMTVFDRKGSRLSELLWPAEDRIDLYIQRMREGYQNKFAESFARSGAGHSRRIFWTKNGNLGLAADGIRPGDLVCLFPGARVPFLIRGPVATFSSNVETRDYYHLVCEAYVHGIMQGELVIPRNLSYETLYII